MSQQGKKQGFLATEEGKKKLREAQKRKSEECEENYTQKKIAKDAYVSLQVVKNLFNPQYKRNVSKEVVKAIAAVLDLLPEEIVGEDAWFGSNEENTFQENNQAIEKFLEDIRERFQELKLFHRQEKVSLQDQYIPIEVTLERRYKHNTETTWGYAESEAELQKVYALKGMEEETRKEQVKWEEARKEYQKLIVLADPGMGKSTLLRMEALKIAGKQFDPPKSPLEKGTLSQDLAIDEIVFPLFLRLSELAETAGEIIEIVPELINREYAKTALAIESLLRQKLETGKCVLLLDALDEVPKEQRQKLRDKLNRFANNYDCPIVCTSRIVGYGGSFLDGAKEVEIVPFNKQQREAYITSWFTNATEYLKDKTVSAQGLIRELQQKPQISGLAQNPLLLSLLCSLYQEKELVLPARCCEVYTQAVKYMLFKWRNNHKPVDDAWVGAKEELLEEIAYCLSCEDKEVFSLRELRRQIDKFLKGDDCSSDFSHAKATDLVKELCEDDGIIQLLPGTDNKYLFLHRTFQEYFTASYLKRVIEEDEARGIELAKEHFWEFDWHETLSLLAGLLENPEPFLAAIMGEKDDIFRHQLLLAGRCVVRCKESENGLVKWVIEEIWEFCKYSTNYSWFDSTLVLLGKSYSQMFTLLLQGLENTDSDSYRNAAKALGRIGGSKATLALISALNHTNFAVRNRAALALGTVYLEKVGDYKVIEALISLLSHNVWISRYTAALVLGRIGSIQATSALIDALNDSNVYVRQIVVWSLGQIGNSKATPALIATLNDADIDVRRKATEALGKIGDFQATSALLNARDNDEKLISDSAVQALEKIGYTQIFKNTNGSISKEPLEVSNNRGDRQATSTLITALNHTDRNVRIEAVRVLEERRDSQATAALITTLNHTDNFLRFAAAKALGKIGDSQATAALIAALSHADISVREAASSVLGEIGSRETLKQILQNPHLDIDNTFIFQLMRKLAVRHSKAKVDFIPVYPETVDLLREKATGNGEQATGK